MLVTISVSLHTEHGLLGTVCAGVGLEPRAPLIAASVAGRTSQRSNAQKYGGQKSKCCFLKKKNLCKVVHCFQRKSMVAHGTRAFCSESHLPRPDNGEGLGNGEIGTGLRLVSSQLFLSPPRSPISSSQWNHSCSFGCSPSHHRSLILVSSETSKLVALTACKASISTTVHSFQPQPALFYLLLRIFSTTSYWLDPWCLG